MKQVPYSLGLLFLCCGSPAFAGAGDSPPKVFDIRAFGAKGDGKTLDTEAIQKTIDACGEAGGGTVRVSAGTYLMKPIFLRQSNITLQLDEGALLQATDEPKDFQTTNRGGALVNFINARGLTNIAITGKGTIDGAGARWWEPVKAAKRAGQPDASRRPRLVTFNNCKNVRVEGITLQNSPMFHLVPSDCEDVTIENVTILAPADSPNTDAIDPAACRHVRITKCVLDVGDDNVAIKSGHVDAAHPDAAAEDIAVTDCTFLHGHGMSIGSETLGGVRNVVVERCTFKDTVSGLRIKSDRDRGGRVENIVYRDIKMENVKSPILFTGYYPRIPDTDTPQPVTARTPDYHKIQISNLTASSPGSAGTIVGLPESLVTDVALENINIRSQTGLTVRNAKAIKLTNVNIVVKKGDTYLLNNAELRGMQ